MKSKTIAILGLTVLAFSALVGCSSGSTSNEATTDLKAPPPGPPPVAAGSGAAPEKPAVEMKAQPN